MFISYAKLAYFKLFLTLFFMMCTESIVTLEVFLEFYVFVNVMEQ